MPKKSSTKVLIVSEIVLFILFYLMSFDCFIIVNINGIPMFESWLFLFLGLISMFILYLLLIKDKIKQIKKESKKIYSKIIKVILKYVVLFTLKSTFLLGSFFFLLFTVQTNSYILSKDGSYYYEYFPSCMVPDSTYECYDSIKVEAKSFYKVYKYMPFIGLPISAKEFYKIKDNSKVILDELNY